MGRCQGLNELITCAARNPFGKIIAQYVCSGTALDDAAVSVLIRWLGVNGFWLVPPGLRSTMSSRFPLESLEECNQRAFLVG